jgi:hypothetical protein
MIAPDTASSLKAERRFDLASAALIGVIAVLAAILAVIQMDTSQNATRAQQQAATLAADLSARIETSSVTAGQLANLTQSSLALGMQAEARMISALTAGDDGAKAIGGAEESAAQMLSADVASTAATNGGAPLDPHTAGLVTATTDDLLKELAEQNRQADLADEYGTRNKLAVFGLSVVALAGVLVGLAAVLREGPAGWFTLISAFAMSGVAIVMALLAFAGPVTLLHTVGIG